MKKKLLKTYVIIEGQDKKNLEALFPKILNGTIELNELKAVAAYLMAVCETANSK